MAAATAAAAAADIIMFESQNELDDDTGRQLKSKLRSVCLSMLYNIWHGKVLKEYVIRFSHRGMLDFVEDCGLDVKCIKSHSMIKSLFI